jgi:hypothetical protein
LVLRQDRIDDPHVVHEPNGVDTDDYAMSVGPEVGATGSKKRKRVPLQHMDGDFSPSLEDSENEEPQQNSDDEDFEDGPLRSKKKLKVQHGHRLQHRTGRLPEEFPQMLRTEEGVIYYCYKGQECDHSDGSDHGTDAHLQDSNLSKRLVIQEDDLDHRCAALRAFSMSICRPALAIFCFDHKLLLPFSCVEFHLRSKHPNTLRQEGGVSSPWSDLMCHVRQALGITSVIPAVAHLEIAQPISFLDPPKPYIFCPANGCNRGFISSGNGVWTNSLKGHVRASANCRESLNIRLTPQTNQSARKARTKLSQPRQQISWKDVATVTLRVVNCQRGASLNNGSWLLCLPDDWLPPDSAIDTAIATLPHMPKEKDRKKKVTSSETVDPDYALALSWIKVFGGDANLLLHFRQLLKLRASNAPTINQSQESWRQACILDQALSRVYEFLTDYLEGALKFVESNSSLFRHSITKG